MGLTAWINALFREFPRLWNCLKTNTYPEDFLRNALGFSPKLCERLPQYLMCFVGLYLLCAGLTLFLRFRLEQKPLSSIPRQIHNIILTCCCAVLIPLLFRLGNACAYIVCYDIKPFQEDGNLGRYVGEAFSNIIYVVLLFAVILLMIWRPAATLFRYLRVYRLRGVPHMILEVGTGLYLICILLLASAFGDVKLYSLIVPAGVVLGTVHCEGYIPEEDDPSSPLSAPVRLEDILSQEKSPETQSFVPSQPEKE